MNGDGDDLDESPCVVGFVDGYAGGVKDEKWMELFRQWRLIHRPSDATRSTLVCVEPDD